jgi:hypothetical protein
MGHFSALRDSTSPIANELNTLIRIHPAFSYIRTGYLYDKMYERFKKEHENLSEARIRTVLHIFHILDEIAHSLNLVDSNIHYSIPEHIFADAIQNPRYKAGSHLVTHESRLRQQQRLRKQEAKLEEYANNAVNKRIVQSDMTTASAIQDPFNSLMRSFVVNKFPNKE